MRLASRTAVLLVAALSWPPPAGAQPSALRIRVLEGQDVANDVRTEKGVTPVVEVRDTDDRPVAGADVTFELPAAGPGGSFHGWMRAQTMRTDGEGKAAAAGFAPNGETGRFEIGVLAKSGATSGETRIVQTNGPVTETGTRPQRGVARRSSRFRKPMATILLGLSANLIVMSSRVVEKNPRSWLGIVMGAGGILSSLAVLTKRSGNQEDKLSTAAGPIEITPIRHASLMIRCGGAVLHVDPVDEAEYAGRPRADLVLITDAYNDHLDPATVASVSKPDTVIYGPEAAARSLPGLQVVNNGETRNWRQWTIEAVPAYNLPRSDGPGRVFHEKGQGNGYVLTLRDKRIYISGNTGKTPELCALRDIDVAFLCMNPPYTLAHDDAAAAVREFRPKVVYPYHYRGSLLSVFRFRDALADAATVVRLRNWYP